MSYLNIIEELDTLYFTYKNFYKRDKTFSRFYFDLNSISKYKKIDTNINWNYHEEILLQQRRKKIFFNK